MEQQPAIEYAKKARHGRGNDVVDDNNIRQVAGCLPIDPVNRRFLLISSSNKNNDNWVLPKGGWEDNETQAQAALRETWEEAGIKGRITRQLGIFEEATKNRSRRTTGSLNWKLMKFVKSSPKRKNGSVDGILTTKLLW
ncbi:unnamed protein product [Absidia cylindrospora]